MIKVITVEKRGSRERGREMILRGLTRKERNLNVSRLIRIEAISIERNLHERNAYLVSLDFIVFV